jgi:hypothetical protein
MGEGTVPLAAGDFKQIYKISQIFDYGKQAPTPDDDVEGSDQGVVEAPFMFEHGEYIYIAYSGGTVDKYYTTNLMRASKNADLQSEASWTQIDFSVFDTNDTYTGIYGADESSYERRQAGPGHISLVHDEAGNIALAYHARPYPEIHSGSAAGGLMDQDRNTWIKAINVRANGMLDMSVTKDQEVAPQNRTVTIRVKVAESDETTAPSVSSIAVRKLPNTIDYTVDEQFSDRGLVIEATMSDGTKKTLQSNEYILDEVDTSKPGTRRVTVMLASDSSISTSFTITVTEKTANPQPVDKTALKAEIAKAGGLQESDYTSRSRQTYCLALQNARHVLADTGATQTQVDQALKDLRNAKLVRKDSVNQSTPNSSSGLANTGTATGIMMLVAIVLAGAGVTLLRRRN